MGNTCQFSGMPKFCFINVYGHQTSRHIRLTMGKMCAILILEMVKSAVYWIMGQELIESPELVPSVHVFSHSSSAYFSENASSPHQCMTSCEKRLNQVGDSLLALGDCSALTFVCI